MVHRIPVNDQGLRNVSDRQKYSNVNVLDVPALSRVYCSRHGGDEENAVCQPD